MIDELLPCPFCGTPEQNNAGPVLVECNRVSDRKKNTRGHTIRRVNISHRVECTYCGAIGPESLTMLNIFDADHLTDDMVLTSAAAARFSWNARSPILDTAYDLVNKILVGAFSQIKIESRK